MVLEKLSIQHDQCARGVRTRNASLVKEADNIRAHHVVPMTREEARNAGRKFPDFPFTSSSPPPQLYILKTGENLMSKMLFRWLLIVAVWLVWKHTAALPLCVTFWIVVLLWAVRPIARRRPSLVWALVLVGVLSNAVVTLANSGVMPADYSADTFVPASRIWQPATTDRHLLWLSDHRVLDYFSVGDLCLLTGCALGFILRRRNKNGLRSFFQGRRVVPCLLGRRFGPIIPCSDRPLADTLS
jgi:hypothetical protein